MTFDSGLEGVVTAETILSEVDGEAARLIIRGHLLADIASHRSLEWLIGALWRDFVPRDLSEAALRRDLGLARVAAFADIAPLLPEASRLAPTEALRRLLAGGHSGWRAEPGASAGGDAGGGARGGAAASRWGRGAPT
jgi:citrate synthase